MGSGRLRLTTRSQLSPHGFVPEFVVDLLRTQVLDRVLPLDVVTDMMRNAPVTIAIAVTIKSRLDSDHPTLRRRLENLRRFFAGRFLSRWMTFDAVLTIPRLFISICPQMD